MRAIVFSYGDAFTAPYTDEICSVLNLANVHVIVIETDATSFDAKRYAAASVRMMFLSDYGLRTLPELSSTDYNDATGDDIDFLAVRSLELFQCGLPADDGVLDPENPAERALRSVALRAETLLRVACPDFIVVANGAVPWSKVICAKARRLKIPCFFWESSFFPRRVLMDASGPHFPPGASEMSQEVGSARLWCIARSRMQAAERYLQTWRQASLSKHAQVTHCCELKALVEFQAGRRGTVFVPLQLPGDAAVFGSAIYYDDLFAFCRDVIACAPAGFGVVFKVHPHMDPAFDWSLRSDIFLREDVLRVSHISIHDLIPRVNLVATLSSNVGLEAAIHGCPVVVGGKPVYAGRGFTFDRTDGNGLDVLFDTALGAVPERKALVSFIAGLFDRNLIQFGDARAAKRFVRRSLRRSAAKGSERAPFEEFDPPPVQRHLGMIRRRRPGGVSAAGG